jgi:DNA-binding CsgD family transcriptional regulator
MAIIERLDLLVKLVAFSLAGKLKLAEGAVLLRRVGLSLRQIADIYDSTPESVSVQIAKARHRGKV